MSPVSTSEKVEALRRSWRLGLTPPPRLTLVEWAERYRRLSKESSNGGKFLASRVEVARGPMLAVTELGVRNIVLMACTQLLKTTFNLVVVQFCQPVWNRFIEYAVASGALKQPKSVIMPAAGAAVMHALLPGAGLDGYDGPSEPVARDPREYTVAGRIAVMPVVGELVRRGGGMDALSGLCSYESLKDMLSDSLAHSSITGIVFDIDNPGGEAGGNLDLAEWLAAQRGSKPFIVSVNSLACGGAYSIASAADQVMIGPDAAAGSIGVVTYHTDLSRKLANDGVVVTYMLALARSSPTVSCGKPALAQASATCTRCRRRSTGSARPAPTTCPADRSPSSAGSRTVGGSWRSACAPTRICTSSARCTA